jgi:TerC family integral membrane protein
MVEFASLAQTWLWLLFAAAVAAMLAVDLGVFQRRAHAVRFKEAALWSAAWIALALAFGGAIWAVEGRERAMLYFTAYVLEKSLSIDNLFVFLVILRFFRIGGEHRSRVLHWGILGAVVMRFVFIYAGVAAVRRSRLVLYAFGVLLAWTGGKLLLAPEGPPDPRESRTLRLLRRVMPVTEAPDGDRFFTRIRGAVCATPLFAALVVVEASDLIFAVDSIPAALGVTPSLFLVYTSNIFAVLGLRALYFLLEASLAEFRYLNTGIALVLVYIGAKLLAERFVHVPTGWSLAIVASVLLAAIAASLAAERAQRRRIETTSTR